MRIINLTFEDKIGRRFNGYDLMQYYNSHGHQGVQFVWQHSGGDSSASKLYDFFWRDILRLPGQAFDLLFGLPDLAYLPLLFWRTQYREADVVHLHLLSSYYFSLMELPLITWGKPTIMTVHDLSYLTSHCIHPPEECDQWKAACRNCVDRGRLVPLHQRTEKLIWHFKKLVYLASKLQLVVATKWMHRNIAASPLLRHFKTHLVPFGLNTALFKPALSRSDLRRELGIDQNHCVIFLRANDSPFKNLPTILAALRKVSTNTPLCILTVDTRGKLDSLRDRFQVVDLGIVSDECRMAKAFGAADIFLMPSSHESFGMMAVEAMACGVPTVVTRGTALEEVTFAPEAALTVPAGDDEALCQAITTLIESPDLRLKLGKRGRELAVEHYDFNLHASRIMDVYRQVIRDRHLAVNP